MALVCGLLPFVVPISSMLAIIFGAIGITRVNRNPNHLSGKGMAIAGLVLGIIGVLIGILVLALFLSIFAEEKSIDQERTCQSQMRTIIGAPHSYAAEHNGKYPTSWDELIPAYTREKYTCPKDGSQYIVKWSADSPPEVQCPHHGSLASSTPGKSKSNREGEDLKPTALIGVVSKGYIAANCNAKNIGLREAS